MPKAAASPVPTGMHTLTPHLWFAGNCTEAIAFYQRALGAEPVGEVAHSPDGKSVWHAMLKLGDACFMLADAMPGAWEQGPRESATAGLWVYVADCDALFRRALDAGCEQVWELMDAFWGDRMGKVKDPFGHCWAIATHQWDLTPEEVEERMQAWLKTLKD